jgi:hypothetical protein
MAVQIAAGIAIRVAACIAFLGVAACVAMLGVVCQATLPREAHGA